MSHTVWLRCQITKSAANSYYNDTMQKEYVDQYYNYQKSNFWFVVRRKLIADVAQKYIKTGTVVANVGAGYGFDSEALPAGVTLHHLDIEKQMCEYALQNFNVRPVCASATDLPYRHDSVDSVMLLDIIEHLESDVSALAEAHRCIRRGGILILTVPAHQFLFGQHDVVNKHYRRYSLNEVVQRIEQAGFTIVKTSFFSMILFLPLALYRITDKLGLWSFLKSKDGSDFSMMKDDWINALLIRVISLERYLLRLRLLLMGSSILVIARKDS